MNIGFISTRLAGVDGVSLETQKLAAILQKMGHHTFFCAGELDKNAQPGKLVPEMHFNHPIAKQLHDAAFSNPIRNPEVIHAIYQSADRIRAELEDFVTTYQIDIIVPQNAITIPMNLALGIAITDLIKRRQIKTLAHHHDFYWERDRFTANGIQDILNEAFPPQLEPIIHMVINRAMQRRLYVFRGIQALYLPNVFDFDNPPPPPDDYANTFRDEIGLSENDLILLQPTRIVRRKGIEKAIELTRKLNDERVVLVITGYEGDERDGYGSWLREEAERAGIRYKFIGEYVDSVRGTVNGHKVYTLWDIYPHARLITYPSLYEGFGNALIETLYFRKPLIVNTYPVYLTDIKPAGIQAIEFNQDITPQTVEQTRNLLDNTALRDELVNHNYNVGLTHFSYRVLHDVLKTALTQLEAL